MHPAISSSTNNSEGDTVEGSPDGVDEIVNISATTGTGTSDISAPPERAGVSIDPDEILTFPLEMKDQPQEAEAVGLEPSSEIRRHSGCVDVEDVVESSTNGKKELLYAIEFSMESPRNEGQWTSHVAEVSCSCSQGSVRYSR